MPQNVLKAIRKSQSNIAKGYSQMTQYVMKNRFASNVNEKEKRDNNDSVLSTALKSRMGRIGTEFIAGAEKEYLKFVSDMKKSFKKREKEQEKNLFKNDEKYNKKKKATLIAAVGTLALLGGLFYTLSIKFKKETHDFISYLSRFKLLTKAPKSIIFREGRHHIVTENGDSEPITEKRYASNPVEEANKNYTKILIDFLIKEKLGGFINDTREGSSPIGYMIASSIRQTSRSATEYLRTLMENPRMGKMYDDIYFMIYNAMKTVMGTITLDFKSKYDSLYVNKKKKIEQHRSHLEVAYKKLSSFETGAQYEFHHNRYEKHAIEAKKIKERLYEIEKEIQQKRKDSLKSYGLYAKDIDTSSALYREKSSLRNRLDFIEEEMDESEEFLDSLTTKSKAIRAIFEENFIERRLKSLQSDSTSLIVLDKLKMADTRFDFNIEFSNDKKKYDIKTSDKNRAAFIRSTFNGKYVVGDRKNASEIKQYFSRLISERITTKATKKDLLDIYRTEGNIPKRFRNRNNITFVEILEYESDNAKYEILRERLIEKPQIEIRKKLDKAYRKRLIEKEPAYKHRDVKDAIKTLRTLSERYFGGTGHFYYQFLDARHHELSMTIRSIWSHIRKFNPFSDTLMTIEKMSAVKKEEETSEMNTTKSAYEYDIFQEIPIETASVGLLEKLSLNIRDFDYVNIEHEDIIKSDRIDYADIAELLNTHAIQKHTMLEQLVEVIRATTNDFYESYNNMISFK